MNIIRFQDDYLGIFTRSYLLQTQHYNVFIDGGLLGGREEKLPYLTDGRKNVLILTHGHWDHIGCDSLTAENGGEVWVHEGDVKHVTDYDWHWTMLFGQFAGDFDLPPARHEIFWKMVGKPVVPDRLLQDGDELVFDDLCLQVIATQAILPAVSACMSRRAAPCSAATVSSATVSLPERPRSPTLTTIWTPWRNCGTGTRKW